MNINRFKRLIRYLFIPVSKNKKNKYFSKLKDPKEKRIIGVYHIYCVNNWKDIFNSQIKNLKNSGLFDITENLYVSIVANDISDLEYIKGVIGEKCIILDNDINENRYEFVALSFIKNISENNNNLYIYYFHTKGVSLSENNYDNYLRYGVSLGKLKRNSNLWREMMNYWIFDKYKLAIKVLDSGMYTYGAYFYEDLEYNFYAGNFWWAKSEYIKLLPAFNSEDAKERYKAETWLMSLGFFDKYYCSFNCIADLYSVPMYKSLYTKFNLYEYIKFILCHYKDCIYRKIYLKIIK